MKDMNPRSYAGSMLRLATIGKARRPDRTEAVRTDQSMRQRIGMYVRGEWCGVNNSHTRGWILARRGSGRRLLGL